MRRVRRSRRSSAIGGRSLWPSRLAVAAIIFLVSFPAAWAATPKSQQKQFETPEEAVQSLIDALRKGDTRTMAEILGPTSSPLVSSGDKVEDQRARDAFVREYDATHKLEAGGGKIVLYVGADNFPFPIPVIPVGASWRFDTPAGREEILNRRIGRNELNTIQVCLAYVDAQREYYAQVRKQGEAREYAQRLASTRASGTVFTGRPRTVRSRVRSGLSPRRPGPKATASERKKGPPPITATSTGS